MNVRIKINQVIHRASRDVTGGGAADVAAMEEVRGEWDFLLHNGFKSSLLSVHIELANAVNVYAHDMAPGTDDQ